MENLLGTPGDGADSTGIFQHALAALLAPFPIPPFPMTAAKGDSIAAGVYHPVHYRCRSLDANAAAEHQQGVGVHDLALVRLEGHPGELLVAGEVNEGDARNCFAFSLQFLFHFYCLLLAAGLTSLRTTLAAHNEHLVFAAEVREDLFHGFLFTDKHVHPSSSQYPGLE